MGIVPLSRTEVAKSALSQLGLPSGLSLDAPEVIAALLRRSAAMRCPCTANALVRTVVSTIKHLVDSDPVELVEDTLERVVDYGDFLELDEQPASGSRLRQLFVAPASFVATQDRVFLVGIADETVEGLPHAVRRLVNRRDVARYIERTRGDEIVHDVTGAGYAELPVATWTLAPRARPAHQVVEQYRSKLRSMPHAAGIEGLTIITGDRPVDYYKGRWATPKRQNGEYVGRRPQPYGAPLWCFVTLSEGVPTGLCDLPVENRGWRGCDEAWYLQAALDHVNGTPQIVNVRRPGGPEGPAILNFYSPLPRWVNRRLQYTGAQTERMSSLLSFSLPQGALNEELKLLQAQLWLRIEEELVHKKVGQR